MNWEHNTHPDFALCCEIFKSQHLKFTPLDLLQNLCILNFDQYLTNIWSETIDMVKSGQLRYYDLLDTNKDLQGFIVGYKDSDTFNIRHFAAKDIENIPASIFLDFAKIVNVQSITMRTRKGITKYHEFITGWNFEYKENIQGYNIYILRKKVF